MRKNKIIVSLLVALILAFGVCVGCAEAAELTVSSTQIVQQDKQLIKTQKQIINKINKKMNNRKDYLSEKNINVLEKIKVRIQKTKSIDYINNQYEKALQIFKHADKIKKVRQKFIESMETYRVTYKQYTNKKLRKLIKRYENQASKVYSIKTFKKMEDRIWKKVRNKIDIPKRYNIDDWSWNKIIFIEKWGSKNYKYLSNKYAYGTRSPMAYYSWDIAEAAWYYGIDPRLCAAISWSESGCGVVNCAPYNAWGWICNAPAMYSWPDGIWKWSKFFHTYFGSYLSYSGSIQYSGGMTSWYSFIMSEASKIGSY